MTERKRGGQAGNQNAAKGTRQRVKFDASLSGRRLAYFENQAGKDQGQVPTDQEIAEAARQMFYSWVDSLIEGDA